MKKFLISIISYFHTLESFQTLKSFQHRSKWKGNERIFCLSLQKTGTTSFGDFFRHFNYPAVQSIMAHRRGWNKFWYLGEYNKIFADYVFKNNQVFEDAPFWAKGFYKVLHKKFPDEKFILFTRNSDAWFDSMVAHGKGGIIGDQRFHVKNYNRPDVIDNPKFDLQQHREYYTQFYENRNQEIIDYFAGVKASFLHLNLEDPFKWNKLADFMEISLPDNFEIHSNKKLEN